MRIPFSLLVLGLILGEIAAFILVGKAIGVLGTLALVLLGIVAGATLLRWTGVATLLRIRAEMAAGRVPTRPLVDGAVGAIAALFLMLPGFISDLVGLLLLVPITRNAIWRGVRRRFEPTRRSRAAFAPRRGAVIELDQSEYAAPADASWRRDGGHEG